MLEEIERPYIVKPRNMVLVVMCDEDGVKVLHALAKHLLPEVRTGINAYRSVSAFNQNGSAQTFVAWVG